MGRAPATGSGGTGLPRDGRGQARAHSGPSGDRLGGTPLLFILWLIAVILVISGIVAMFRGALLYGIALIVLGLLVGPGGVSIFT